MPSVVAPVKWVRPIAKPIAEAVRAATDAPFKHNLGSGSCVFIGADIYYNDQKALAMDLAAAMNQEMKDLVSRGVDLIQIAEPLGFYESRLGWWRRSTRRSRASTRIAWSIFAMSSTKDSRASVSPKQSAWSR